MYLRGDAQVVIAQIYLIAQHVFRVIFVENCRVPI